MQSITVLSALQKHCNPKNLPVTLTALRHDPLIWEYAAQTDFDRYVQWLAEKHSTLSWSPASLTTFELDTDLSVEGLRKEPMSLLDGNLQRQALAVFEETLRTGRAPLDLREAGLLALALRERRRKIRSWNGVSGDLAIKGGLGTDHIEQVWKTALACLYGMISDPNELLKTLFTGSPESGMAWCIHVVLANPAEEDAQARTLVGLILESPLDVQAKWLIQVESLGRASLAEKIARMLLAANQPQFDGLKTQFNPAGATQIEVLSLADQLKSAATIYRCAGALLQSASMIDKSKQLLAFCLAETQLRMANLDLHSEKMDAAASRVEKAFSICAEPAIIELGASILQAGGFFDVDLPASDRERGLLSSLYLAGQMTNKGNIELGRQTAKRAVEEWLSRHKFTIGQAGELDHPGLVLTTLMRLGMLKEAARSIDVFLLNRPGDERLLQLAAQVAEKNGELENAAAFTETIVLLDPHATPARRELARLLENQEKWAQALDHRRQILHEDETTKPEDQIALANCAIQANEPQAAIEACDQLLATEPDNGIAHTLKGQALVLQDRVDEAINHLSRATLLCADLPRPWVALAEAQQKKGEMQRALDTMRAAVLAVPDSSEIHYHLAKILLNQGLLTDALPNLRQAARLSPEAASVTIELAKTLRQLGHLPEAVRVLSEARQRWPREPQLAYLEAMTYHDLSNRSRALESLEVAIKSEQPQVDWLRLYVQLQLVNPDQLYAALPLDYDPLVLQRVTQALQKILALAPTDYTARLWMADLLRLRGQERLAFETYQQLLDECDGQDETLHNRVQAGFGAAALAANELDTALASLQEVSQAIPDDLGIMHLIAETYQKLNLAQETVHASEQALQAEPDQVANLVWYASMMERLNKLDDARKALGTAAQLAPERADLWLKQAQFALASNQLQAARQLLLQLETVADIAEPELIQAAKIHIQLEDFQQALSCLKKLESATDAPNPGLLCDLAFLSQQAGDDQNAMAYVERAVGADDQNIRLHILQADLLAQQGRSQAALACLEKATRLMESKPLAEKQTVQQQSILFITNGVIFSPSSVYARSAVLLKKQNDIPAALFYAEKALEINPSDLSVRLFAASLAYSQLQFDQVLELASAGEQTGATTLLHDDSLACWQVLQALRCELLLDAGNEVDVSAAVNLAAEQPVLQPRMKAIQIRLLARNGEYESAWNLFKGLADLKKNPVSDQMGEKATLSSFYQLNLTEYASIWLGQAAQDLYLWDAADRHLAQGRLEYPHEAISHYQFAREIIQRAKAFRLCEATHASEHCPAGKPGLGEVFDAALNSSSQFSGSSRISELRQIGKMIFQGTSIQGKPMLADGKTFTDQSALVIGLAQGGNLPAAIKVAEQSREQSDVCAQIAVLLMQTDLEIASQFADAAVEVEPRQPLYHAVRAILLSKANKPADVMEAWQLALQLWPDEPVWHVALAQLSLSLGSAASAIQHWEAAFDLKPNKAEYALRLGQVYIEMRNYGKAIDILETASRLDGNDVQIWLTLAEAYLRAGHLDRALQCALRATSLEPESLHGMLLQGEILIQMGNLTAAQEISDRALQRGNTIPEVVVFNVHLLQKRGKLHEALAVLEKAADLLSGEMPVQLERAQLIRQVYGSAAALPVITDVAQKFPGVTNILTVLAAVQYECGDMASAEKSAQQALRQDPEQGELHLLLGRIKTNGGQLDQAIYHLSQAVQFNPTDVEGYIDLGKVYQERREQEKAVVTFQQAIKAAPRDTRPYVLAASALREVKDYSAAETMLRKASELAPNDLAIHRQLGAVIALNLVQHSQEAQAWH